MQSNERRRVRRNTHRVVGVAVFAMFAAGGGTLAAQELVNRDDAAHTVTVMVKNERREETLEPAAKLEAFCPDGCVIRIDGDEQRDFIVEGGERLSIEGGLVYFDGEVTARPQDGGETPAPPEANGETRTD